MLSMERAQELAHEWVEAWNSHNLDAILSHYSDDVVLTSPIAVERLKDPSGTVRGKKALQEYFAMGLAAWPELHFNLERVLPGVESFVMLYRSIRNRRSAEVCVLDGSGKICRVYAHYADGE